MIILRSIRRFRSCLARLMGIVHSAPNCCPCCGGTKLSNRGKDVSASLGCLVNRTRESIGGMGMDVRTPGYTRIEQCRVGGGRTLISVLNLGHQELTGVFPKTREAAITSGLLELLWGPDSGLLQLAHTHEAS